VWLVDIDLRSVTVRLANAAPATCSYGETLPGGDVLPGFELPLSDLFE
jgi:hypothetical protein